MRLTDDLSLMRRYLNDLGRQSGVVSILVAACWEHAPIVSCGDSTKKAAAKSKPISALSYHLLASIQVRAKVFSVQCSCIALSSVG